jgi:redox-sensing transcriptional repressor
MKAEKISELTTSRLSVYLRCLNELAEEGTSTVSSETLASRFHLNSAQIRKDLAYFGEFGVRGVGYYVDGLRNDLTKILGLDRCHRVCIIGAGRIGTAIADYYGFKGTSFTVAALFDTEKKKVGKKVNGVPIFDAKSFQSVVKKDNIDLAIIAVPAEHAQSVLDKAVKAGIKAVLNVAPVPLKVPPGTKVKSVDLTISLEGLAFYLAGGEQKTGSLKPAPKRQRKK